MSLYRRTFSRGGRSSARSDLFQTDASLSGDTSGINLPPVPVAEFLHLDSKPTLRAAPSTSVSVFRFGEDEHTRFFSPQTLAPVSEAFGCSLKAPDAIPLVSKDYRLLVKSWLFVFRSVCFRCSIGSVFDCTNKLVDKSRRVGGVEGG